MERSADRQRASPDIEAIAGREYVPPASGALELGLDIAGIERGGVEEARDRCWTRCEVALCSIFVVVAAGLLGLIVWKGFIE